MKPVLEHLPVGVEESFVIREFAYDYFPTPWHFHPEFELVLVVEGTGKRFIGDQVGHFEAGNLAFLGPGLPHLYRNDAAYYHHEPERKAKSVVIHFLETSFGRNFLDIPETRKIKGLFAKSARGIDIRGNTNKIITRKMFALLSLHGFSRWLCLLDILNTLAESKELRYISCAEVSGQNETESIRMNKIFEFVLKNFSREIRISEVANLVNMAENSFSRYFSNRTRKTFSAFVNEIRLNNACGMIIENENNISEICFESGFNNLSNFNRHFKKKYKCSPLAYRCEYLKGSLILSPGIS